MPAPHLVSPLPEFLHRAASTLVLAAIVVSSGFSQASAGPPQAKKSPVADYALIFGTVWGPDNQPVAGIPITIRRSSDKKPKWNLVSDRRGEFAQRVPPGTQEYVVQADVKVPKGEPKPEVTVKIDDNERQDIGIHLKQLPK